MKTPMNASSLLLLTLALYSYSAKAIDDQPVAPNCVHMQGTYQGQCTMADGYKYSEYLKLDQRTEVDGMAGGGAPLHRGDGCASVSITEWVGDIPQKLTVLENETFELLASTKIAETNFSNGQTTIYTEAQWNIDRSNFSIHRTTKGKVENHFPFIHQQTFSYALSGQTLIRTEYSQYELLQPSIPELKIPGGSYDNNLNEQCVFTAIR